MEQRDHPDGIHFQQARQSAYSAPTLPMTHTLYRGRERILPDAAMQALAVERQEQVRGIREAAVYFPQDGSEKTFDEMLSNRLTPDGPREPFPLSCMPHMVMLERAVALPLRLLSPFAESGTGCLVQHPHHFYNQGRRVLPAYETTG